MDIDSNNSISFRSTSSPERKLSLEDAESPPQVISQDYQAYYNDPGQENHLDYGGVFFFPSS